MILFLTLISLCFHHLELIKTVPVDVGPKSVYFSPDGKYVVANCLYGHRLNIIDPVKMTVIRRISVPGEPVECDFTGNGRYIWFSLYDKNEVCVYDYELDSIIRRIKVGKVPKILKVSPDEQWVYVSNWSSATVSVVDAKSFIVVKEIKVIRKPRGVVFTSNGDYAYIANMGGGHLTKIDVRNGHKKLTNIPAGVTPRHLVMTRDGRYIYQTNNLEGVVRKFSVKDEQYMGKANVGKKVRSCILSPDEQYLFVCNYGDNEIGVVDVNRMMQIYTIKTGNEVNGHPIGVTISPDGDFLWVSNYRGGVNVYRIVREID